MSSAKLLTSTPAPPSVAALVYAGLLLVLIAATTLPIKSVLDQWDEVAALTGTLRLLDAHSMVPAHQDGEGVIRKGSAFLEGPTVTVAGAVLLQRLGDVVTRHSGSMSSSQLDVQGPRAN
ncbi:GspMb/PilO family protein, partial [Pseudomonas aeruginosa]